MLKTMSKEHKTILAIVILFIINAVLFWLKQGSLVIDAGREFYIPWQMLKGQVLYKDIFNIYGPLSYQINSLAYMILGQKISSLYLCGVLNSFVCIITIYFISREFLDRKFSFIITIFLMQGCVFTLGLFNYNLPYAYSMPYSFSSFLLSLLFLIKFISFKETNEENKIKIAPIYAYLSSFFIGISIATKYDFLLFPLVILFTFLFVKKLSAKELAICATAFLLAPVVSYGILFLQGLSIKDLLLNSSLVLKMTKCSTLKFLYTNYVGTYFNPHIFKNVVLKFIPLAVFFAAFSLLNYFEKYVSSPFLNKVQNVVKWFAIFLITLCVIKEDAFGFLPIFLTIALILGFKKIYADKALFVLILAALISSVKTYFALNMYSYGAYSIPLILLTAVVLIVYFAPQLIKKEEVSKATIKTVFMLLVSFVIMVGAIQICSLVVNNGVVKTPRGSIHTLAAVAKTYNDVQEYILANTKPTDRVVVWPETPFLNFFTSRDSDNKYFSMIPLYVELFGEKKIISDISKSKPEYFILNNRDSSDYGYKYICKDYAKGICSYVSKNYSSVKIVSNDFYTMSIYKRKDLK